MLQRYKLNRWVKNLLKLFGQEAFTCNRYIQKPKSRNSCLTISTKNTKVGIDQSTEIHWTKEQKPFLFWMTQDSSRTAELPIFFFQEPQIIITAVLSLRRFLDKWTTMVIDRLFLKGLGGKYFWFCGLQRLCYNYSTLDTAGQYAATDKN